jgi:hypothetical protein
LSSFGSIPAASIFSSKSDIILCRFKPIDKELE